MVVIDKTSLLSQVPVFSELGEVELQRMGDITLEKTFKKGEVLIEQADSTTAAFVIASGLVKVYRTLTDGTILNLAVIGPKEIIGEMSLFDDEPRSATVTAIEETKVLMIRSIDFQQFLKENQSISFLMMKMIARRLRMIHQKIEERISRNLPKRTYKTIQCLAKFYENDDIPLSQEELSEIVGATRARVTEALQQIEKEGKIKISYRNIHLVK